VDTDSEEDSIYDPSNPIPLLDDDSHHPPDHNEEQFSSASDLKQIHGAWEDQISTIESNETLDNLAYSRFGFSNIAFAPEPQNKVEWVIIKRSLGCFWQSLALSKALEREITIFFSHLRCHGSNRFDMIILSHTFIHCSLLIDQH
jgi:hypothetical protein